MTTNLNILENQIREAAKRRFSAVDASIVKYRDRFEYHDPDDEWYGASIRLTQDGPWEVLGRRRSRMELLEMVERLQPAHIGGRRF